MRVLVIGATGMLGYSIFSNLSENQRYDTFGTVRNIKGKEHFFAEHHQSIIQNIDIEDSGSLIKAVKTVKPDVVINCIGLIKQQQSSRNHIKAISVNSLFPHQLARICDQNHAKLIHFSTDCVFSGGRGNYLESDSPDATDLYGKSKHLGEIDYNPHLTLRTSIIGHELNSTFSLIDWFLSQKKTIKGFSKAIFSGLPTVFIAQLLMDKILPRSNLSGNYHLSVDPIDKYSLLNLVAQIYNKNIEITEDTGFQIDRSLDSSLLRRELSLQIPSWQSLITNMHKDYLHRYLTLGNPNV